MSNLEEKKCEHHKVYSGTTLMSSPPQYPWICKKCGVEGVDRGQYKINEYEKLVQDKKDGKFT